MISTGAVWSAKDQNSNFLLISIQPAEFSLMTHKQVSFNHSHCSSLDFLPMKRRIEHLQLNCTLKKILELTALLVRKKFSPPLNHMFIFRDIYGIWNHMLNR